MFHLGPLQMLGKLWRDHLHPPTPSLTEKNLPDQTGKVFLVTGGSSGVGENLCRILYGANARVYVAARSQEKMDSAISRIKTAHPDSKGTIEALKLDLADLTTIKASAEAFLSKESHLDVLWLNAGVMIPPDGSKTVQGYELQLGTNNLGHWLFVRYLHPLLKKTAETAPKNSVRVIWVSSSAAELVMNPPIDFDNMDYHKNEMPSVKYGRSKAGNAVHSCEFARRFKDEGIISLSLNPGNLNTELQRHGSWILSVLLSPIIHTAIYGAYTELYAGLSQDITEERNGGWLQPWGRFEPIRSQLADEETGKKYWEWTEEQVKDY